MASNITQTRERKKTQRWNRNLGRYGKEIGGKRDKRYSPPHGEARVVLEGEEGKTREGVRVSKSQNQYELRLIKKKHKKNRNFTKKSSGEKGLA